MLYVFRFGYETPVQLRNNERHGWDDEDSTTVIIDAASEDEASAWGEHVAEQFVSWLYRRDGGPDDFSWRAAKYAAWVEPMSPEFERAGFAIVATGAFPDFRRLLPS